MSLRKKACSRCVTAKRRCDRGLPACRRCTKQRLTCEYPGLPPPRTLPVVGATGPFDFASRGLSQEMSTLASTGFAMPGMSTNPGTSDLMDVLPFENDSFPLANLDLSTDTLGIFEDMGGFEERSFATTEDMASAWPTPTIGTELELPQAESNPDGEFHINHDSRSLSACQISATTSHILSSYASSSLNQPSSTEYVSDIARLRCVEQMWSRGQDVPRWKFCANEVLSFVHLFSRTGSAPFLVPRKSSSDGMTQSMPAPLLRAMGVCASYVTANDTGRPIFEQLLEMEVNAVVESSNSEYLGSNASSSQLDEFRAELVRVQAMTMYRIIGLFSPNRRMRLLAEKHEPLITSWTRQLFLRLQVLERGSDPTTSSASSSTSAFFSSLSLGSAAMGHTQPSSSTVENPPFLQEEEIASAYKTVLMSHLVRTIHTSLMYQVCRNLPELRSVPVLTSTLGEKTRYNGLVGPPLPPGMLGSGNRRPPKMTYNDYADSWKDEELRCLDRGDRFTVLLLTACKGIGFLNLQ